MENVALVSLDNKSMTRPAPRPIARTTTQIAQYQDPPLPRKLLAAGTAACIADLFTFPLDTAKVRLQIQGEALAHGSLAGGSSGRLNVAAYHTTAASAGGAAAQTGAQAARYRGVFGTIATIARVEGPRALYNGIIPGLQRQMAFASIRIGLYDSVKHQYNALLGSAGMGVRIMAGMTTGATAVLVAQPTDVVKVRMQAARAGEARYTGSISAYRSIAKHEGIRGLWKGTSPNVARTTIVNACELVSYDMIKEKILEMRLLSDNMPCHFVSACGAGFVTTVVASPVDVVKTRFMNSGPGTYGGIVDCAAKMFQQEGPSAFYKGFMPSFLRLASWNIAMFLCYEQLKRALAEQHHVPQIDMRIPKTQTA